MVEIGQLTRLNLGYVGETGSRQIEIDVSAWLQRWPEGAVAINVRRPDGSFYLAATETEAGILGWVVNASDVAVAGRGMAQVIIYGVENGTVYKSRTVETIIRASIDEVLDEDAPDPMETWVAHAAIEADRATQARIGAEEAKEAATEAKEAAETAAEDAETERQTAEEASRQAQDAADAATESAEDAAGSAKKAAEYEALADAQRAAAAQKATEAETSANTAKTYAQDAEGSALEADEKAQAAAEHAKTAEGSAQEAATYAGEAKAAADMAAMVELSSASAIVIEASGVVAAIADAAARGAQALVTTISPTTGGVAEVTLTHTGRNLMPFTKDDVHAITYTRTNGNSRTVNGYEVTLPPGTYQLRGEYKDPNAGYVYYVYGVIIDADGKETGKANANPIVGATVSRIDFTIDEGETLLLYNGSTSATLNATKTMLGRVDIGIYMPGNDTTYTPYEGQTLTAALPVTVHGGTLDWLTGELTVTHDAAAAELDEPITYQISPQQLTLLKGSNAIWSDAGDTAVTYIADTKLYIDNALAAIAASIINA